MKLKNLLVAVLLTLAGNAQAQLQMAIPVDKDVRIGKLSNGLTYYIRTTTGRKTAQTSTLRKRLARYKRKKAREV